MNDTKRQELLDSKIGALTSKLKRAKDLSGEELFRLNNELQYLREQKKRIYRSPRQSQYRGEVISLERLGKKLDHELQRELKKIDREIYGYDF